VRFFATAQNDKREVIRLSSPDELMEQCVGINEGGTKQSMTHSHSWWQTGVIYQIYPRSFLESNGDGIGVLNFSTQDQVVMLPEQVQGRVLLSTHVDREELIPLSNVHLRGNEGLLIEVEAS